MRVKQVPNRFLDGEVGGMTVYYTGPYDDSKATAFKPVHFNNFTFFATCYSGSDIVNRGSE